MTHIVKLKQCAKCGQVYPIVPYYPHAAPHGPNRDCHGRIWNDIEEEHPPASDRPA